MTPPASEKEKPEVLAEHAAKLRSRAGRAEGTFGDPPRAIDGRRDPGSLRSQQQMARLLDGRARIFGKLLIRSAADRVADDDELVVRACQEPGT